VILEEGDPGPPQRQDETETALNVNSRYKRKEREVGSYGEYTAYTVRLKSSRTISVKNKKIKLEKKLLTQC
jgi:hypothetical protein